MNKTRIAIQGNGRLTADSLAFLVDMGLSFTAKPRQLLVSCSNAPVDILLLRDDDIPACVARGTAAYGIVGKDVLMESGSNVAFVRELGFSLCSLVLALPNDVPYSSVRDLQGKRIATSYPRILRRFLRQRGIWAKIIPLSGSVEIAPATGIADAVCDLVQSGKTLRENGLRLVETILRSEAVLIATESVSVRNTPLFPRSTLPHENA